MEKTIKIKTLEQAKTELIKVIKDSETSAKAEADFLAGKTLIGKRALSVYTWLKDNKAKWESKEVDSLKAFIVSLSNVDAYNRLLRNINYYKNSLIPDSEKEKKKAEQAEKTAERKRNAVLTEQELTSLRQYKAETEAVISDKDKTIAKLQAEVKRLSTELKKYQLKTAGASKKTIGKVIARA